jgi:hypothetical protein
MEAIKKNISGRSIVKICFVSCLFALLSIETASAQAPYLAKGNQELNVFGGLSYGLDHWRGSYGGNYAYAFNKVVMAYGEYSYFPGVARNSSETFPNSPITLPEQISLRFNDVHAGVHIRLPIFPEKRIVPYVAAGMGWLRSDVSGSVYVNNVPYPLELAKHNGLAINGGGGLRLYLSGDGRFGLRLEAKAYKPVSGPTTASFGKVSLGIFYQFK